MKMQYNAIKAEHPDCLLFSRLGDFYEMFDDDAVLGARELNLALTTRDRGKPEDERTPMCGVPYHSAEQYISKLIAKGYKVAVCEQMEDPKLCKGLVSRDIVRIISPGTIMETSMLREGESNYLGAVMLRGKAGGCAFADVSTGEVCAASFETDAAMHIQNEISRFRPRADGAEQRSGRRQAVRAAEQCQHPVSPLSSRILSIISSRAKKGKRAEGGCILLKDMLCLSMIKHESRQNNEIRTEKRRHSGRHKGYGAAARAERPR